MMIESRALDQRGLCPQVKNFLGRISLVSREKASLDLDRNGHLFSGKLDTDVEDLMLQVVFDAQGVHKTGVRAFLRVPLDIRYQLGN